MINRCLGWVLLCQFSPFRYFPNFSQSNQQFPVWYHIHIWQVSPQLSCGDTWQIWTWLEISDLYFCWIKISRNGEINEWSFNNPWPLVWVYHKHRTRLQLIMVTCEEIAYHFRKENTLIHMGHIWYLEAAYKWCKHDISKGTWWIVIKFGALIGRDGALNWLNFQSHGLKTKVTDWC